MSSPPAPGTPAPAQSPAQPPAQPLANPEAEAPIEAEEPEAPENDGASSHGSVQSSTASFASSIVDYPVEFGRRYHKLRAGSYVMPNDEPEMERLNMLHDMVIKALDDRLYLAPLETEKIQRILDIGTGTGVWAIEMGDELPHAEIIGNDLSAIQPTWVPPNVKFEVDDVESEWAHSSPFDFIFCRYMTAAITDWPKLVRTMYENTKPGGWVEMQDFDAMYYSQDNTLAADSNIKRWLTTLFGASEQFGRHPAPGRELKNWMEAAGFRNIGSRKIMMPVGPWPKDPKLKEIGTYNLVQTLTGLEAFTLRLFCNVLGWAEEEVTVLLAGVRNELKNPRIHAIYDLYVCYGQKPGNSDS